MIESQHEARTYPMMKHWHALHNFYGFLMWWGALSRAIICPFDRYFFPWTKKVFPAYRRMMAGERRSYLRVSEEGLVYRNWPLYETRCKWQDVKRINWGRWLGDALFLHRAEYIGYLEFSIDLISRQIHLSSLVGWAEGGLKDELRRYAPQLFTNQP